MWHESFCFTLLKTEPDLWLQKAIQSKKYLSNLVSTMKELEFLVDYLTNTNEWGAIKFQSGVAESATNGHISKKACQ